VRRNSPNSHRIKGESEQHEDNELFEVNYANSKKTNGTHKYGTGEPDACNESSKLLHIDHASHIKLVFFLRIHVGFQLG